VDRLDDFNRANGAIGAASDGKGAWSVLSGTATIAGNEAVLSNNGVAVLEAAVADGIFSVTLGSTIGSNPQIVYRGVDGSNFLIIVCTQGASGAMQFWSNVGGSFGAGATANSGSPFAEDDVISIELSTFNVVVKRNGVQVLSNNGHFQFETETKFGLRGDGVTTFKNVSFDDPNEEPAAESDNSLSDLSLGFGQLTI
jgi:hypothetical protein